MKFRLTVYMIRRNHVWQMLLSVLEASVQEWWFPKTVWCLPIIIVALAVFSNILQWSMIT